MSNATFKSRMDGGQWSMLVLLAILWGGAFFFVELALDAFSPLLLVAMRLVLGAVLVCIFVLARGYPIPGFGRVWLTFLGMGLLNNVLPFILIAWGQTTITAGLAAILIATTPVFGVALAGLCLKDEPFTRQKFAGTIIGMIGVAILIGPAVWSGFSSNLVSQLAVLVAAVSYAFAGVYGRRFSAMSIHPMVAAAGQLLASSAFMIPLVLIFDDAPALAAVSAIAWAAVGALAVLSTALGYVLYFHILEKSGAVNLLLVNLLLPVTAILLGSVFLGEILTTWQLLGMAVVGIGLIALNGRLWQRSFS